MNARQRSSGRSRWVVPAWVLLGLLTTVPARAEADNWDHVTRLKAGTRVRVHLAPTGRKLGAFVRADDRELVLLVDTVHEIIERERIRRIDRDRPLARAAPWIGMLAGGILIAVAQRNVDDFTPLGHTMWFGIGSGIGATGGAVVRRATRFGPIDPPPARVQFVYASASAQSTDRPALICDAREEFRVRKRPADASFLRWNECMDLVITLEASRSSTSTRR